MPTSVSTAGKMALKSPLPLNRLGNIMAHAWMTKLAREDPAYFRKGCEEIEPGVYDRGPVISEDILYSTVAIQADGAGLFGAPSALWFSKAQGDTDTTIGLLTGNHTNLQEGKRLPDGDRFDVEYSGVFARVNIPSAAGGNDDLALMEGLLNRCWWTFDRAREVLPEGPIWMYTAPGYEVHYAQGNALAGVTTNFSRWSPNSVSWDDLRRYDPPRSLGRKSFNMELKKDPLAANAAFANAEVWFTIMLVGPRRQPQLELENVTQGS